MCVRVVVRAHTATLGTRAHYLLDLPAGLLLAELFARAFFRPLERRGAFESKQGLSPFLLAVFAAVPFSLYAVFVRLGEITGWQGLANMVA